MTTTSALSNPDEELFKRDLTALLNRYSLENGSNTPDFIIAEFMFRAFLAFQSATTDRERWYGREYFQTAAVPQKTQEPG